MNAQARFAELRAKKWFWPVAVGVVVVIWMGLTTHVPDDMSADNRGQPAPADYRPADRADAGGGAARLTPHDKALAVLNAPVALPPGQPIPQVAETTAKGVRVTAYEGLKADASRFGPAGEVPRNVGLPEAELGPIAWDGTPIHAMKLGEIGLPYTGAATIEISGVVVMSQAGQFGIGFKLEDGPQANTHTMAHGTACIVTGEANGIGFNTAHQILTPEAPNNIKTFTRVFSAPAPGLYDVRAKIGCTDAFAEPPNLIVTPLVRLPGGSFHSLHADELLTP